MKNLILIIILAGLVSGCAQNQAEQHEEMASELASVEIPELNIASFDVEAANYVDSEITVAGIVDHVCKHGGKKLKLVTDGASVHVESESRFDDALIGNEISLNGIVRELRVDEGYCLQMEEDNIAKHKEGETNDEDFTHKKEQIQAYRDSMAVAGVDHLSFYTLDFIKQQQQVD